MNKNMKLILSMLKKKTLFIDTQKDVEKSTPMVKRNERNIDINKEFEKKEECKIIFN